MTDGLYATTPGTGVLCAGLYNKLNTTLAGGVTVAAQGERFYSHSVQAAAGYSTRVDSGGEYYRVNCPFCHDSRKRLWVSHMYGQPDVNGKPMRFLATCYNEDCLSDVENWRKFDELIHGFSNVGQRGVSPFHVQDPEWGEPTVLAPVEMPGNVIAISALAATMPDHPAVQYMVHARRYALSTLDHYEVSYCLEAKQKYRPAAGRVIFPIKMRGELVGWQARHVGETDWHGIPKYYGMPGMKKRLMLYNYDNAVNKPFVVLTEGVTDCHVLGDTSVALLGKSLTTFQEELVINTWAGKPVVLLLDPEEHVAISRITNTLLANRVPVVVVTLPDGYDCGDYDRAGIWNIIYNYAQQAGIYLPQA